MERQQLLEGSVSAIEALSFAYESAKALLHNIPDRPGVIFRPVYEANALTPETLPLNTEDEILPSFLELLRSRNIRARLPHYPYWNEGITYNSAEVFGATIQSLDLHDAPLPRTVLRPNQMWLVLSLKSSGRQAE